MPNNWLVPLTPSEIAQQAEDYTSAQIDPLLDAIMRQQRRGNRAIRRYSNQAARRLRPLARQTRRDYRLAAAQDAAISDVLGRVIEGGSGAGSLADALRGVAGQGGRAAGARAFAQGAGGAAVGMGASALEQLVSQGASETAYARKLPGIAKLAGAEAMGQLNTAAMSEAERIRASAPGIYQDILQRLRSEQIGIASDNRARRDEKANAAGGGLTPEGMQSAKEQAFGAAVGVAQDLFQQEVTTTDKFGKETTKIVQVPYEEALRRVTAIVQSTLGGLYPPAQIRALAAQALAAAGYQQGGAGSGRTSAFKLPLGLGAISVPMDGASVGAGQLAR